jgi:hypothetical protein
MQRIRQGIIKVLVVDEKVTCEIIWMKRATKREDTAKKPLTRSFPIS